MDAILRWHAGARANFYFFNNIDHCRINGGVMSEDSIMSALFIVGTIVCICTGHPVWAVILFLIAIG